MAINLLLAKPSTIKRAFLFLLCSALTLFAKGQDFFVTGKLIDSVSREPVNQATILVASEKDTSLHLSALSSETGVFEIRGLAAGNYLLTVTYQKLHVLTKRFSLSTGNPRVEFGTIKVEPVYNKMPEVVIKEQSPITTKGDTLVYKTNAYKTQPDALVEDLLKRLPGVQVDRAGNVKAQGEQVQKVYVDGKEFFGSDPKMATKNLTADMIEQVQVFNDVSEQAKFNGIDDGNRTKAINLKLKKAKKSGMFGNAYAGYGTNNRYQAGVSANLFKGASQLSLIAGASNIAPATATSSGQMSGNNSLGAGRTGSGLNKSSSLGLNSHDFVGKALDVTASYLLLNDRNTNIRKAYRQTFLNDSTQLTSRESDYITKSTTHRFNIKLAYTLDTMNVIVFTPILSIQNLQSSNNDQFVNFVQKKDTNYRTAESQTASTGQGQPVNWVGNLVWRKKFSLKGRTFFASLTNMYNQNNMGIYSVINSKLYNQTNSMYRPFDKDYHIRNNNYSNAYSFALSYTEPIGTKNIAEINYSFSNNNSRSNRKTYNYNPGSKAYDQPDDSLTNEFSQANRWNRVGVNFKGMSNNLNYQVGIALQQMLLRSNDLSKNNLLSHNFVNLLPTASFNYRFSSGKNLQVQYRGRSNQPDIRQLQNVTDITAYPYIQKGNPALKQEFVHTANLSYNAFNRTNFRSLFVFITYNNIRNKIASSLLQNAAEQIQMPININGAYNVNGTVGLGIPFTSWEGASLNTSTQIDFSQNVNLVNNVRNFTKEFIVAQDLMLNYNSGAKLDAGVSLSTSYNAVKYTLQKTQNASYFIHSLSLNSSYAFEKGITLSNTVDYTAYTGNVNRLDQNYVMWNASLTKTLFRNKKGSLKFSINDILDKNININRYRADNYIEDVQNTTLRRFAMLTFVYKLNETGK